MLFCGGVRGKDNRRNSENETYDQGEKGIINSGKKQKLK